MMIPSKKQQIWSCSVPVTCERCEIPFKKRRIWWFGGKQWQRALISASPQVQQTQPMRCFTTPWWSWWRISDVIEQKMSTKGRFFQNGCWIGFILASLHTWVNTVAPWSIVSSASRIASKSQGAHTTFRSPSSSCPTVPDGHSPVLVQVTRTSAG